MTYAEPLTEAEIAASLADHPGWHREGDEITRTFRHTYRDCARLALAVAGRADELGHHPDMAITWQRITFRVTTHAAGGRLTAKDFQLAGHIDGIAAEHGAEPA